MKNLAQIHELISTSTRAWILWWLCNMPLASITDLERIGPYSYKQIHTELTRLRGTGSAFAVEVGWHRRHQHRWALARHAVVQASEMFFDGAVPWPTTEDGLKNRLDNLPAMEIFYETSPGIRRKWMAHRRQAADENPDLEDEYWVTRTLLGTDGLDLGAFTWHWNRFPQAVADYTAGGRFDFAYVDAQADAKTLAKLATARSSEVPGPEDAAAVLRPGPVCWVIVCEGAVSTKLARRHLWPDESKIIVQLTGSDTRTQFPLQPRVEWGSPDVNPRGPITLGHPEHVIDWVKNEPSMLVYRDRMAGRLFSLAEEYSLIRPTDAAQLWGVSGKIVKAAAEDLKEKGLINRDVKEVSLAAPGASCVARRSVSHHQTISSRYGLLDEGGETLSKNARRHRRQFARMAIQWRKLGLYLEPGDRLDFDPGDGERVTPDGWVELMSPVGDGGYVLFAVELEGPRPKLDSAMLRVRPYLAAQRAGGPQPLLLIFQTLENELRLLETYPHIWAATTTVSEAMHGAHRGEKSIWRHGGHGCDIDYLLTVTPAQEALETRSNSWWGRLLGGNRR